MASAKTVHLVTWFTEKHFYLQTSIEKSGVKEFEKDDEYHTNLSRSSPNDFFQLTPPSTSILKEGLTRFCHVVVSIDHLF